MVSNAYNGSCCRYFGNIFHRQIHEKIGIIKNVCTVTKKTGLICPVLYFIET